MLGSTVLGGVMTIWSQSIKAKQAEQKMLLARADKQAAIFKEAREYENTGFQWTRRIIALTAIKPGFLFLEGKEVMKWVPMAHRGIVITPLDTNLVSAIIGLYFGGSLVKK